MAHVPSRRSFDEVRHLPAFHPLLPEVAKGLTAECASGDRERALTGKPRSPTVFDGGEPANTSIEDYLVRLCKYAHCSPHTWPVMRVYIDRLREARRALGEPAHLNSHNIHRVVLSCFVVAAKLRDDVYYANKYYAQVGGVSTRDMNKMEGALLEKLDWRTHVDMDELLRYGLLQPAEEEAVRAARKNSKVSALPSSEEEAEVRAVRKNSAVPTLRGAVECSPSVDDLGSAATAVAA